VFATGFAIERFVGVPGGAVVGLFAGLLAASWIPAKAGCGAGTRPHAGTDPPR
jgi:hypothetical protein